MIRQTTHTLLSADYEIFDEEVKVGTLKIKEGVIYELRLMNNVKEDFKGQVLFKLFDAACGDANKMNANLSIMTPKMQTQKLKRFLDHFRFMETHENVFKRLAGTPLPASVIY